MIMIIILTVIRKRVNHGGKCNQFFKKKGSKGDKAPLGQFRLIVIIIPSIREQTKHM